MVKKGMMASERHLFELLKTALAQLQDDEALLTELITLDNNPSPRTMLVLHNMAHIRDELRKIGIAVPKREPFDDDAPVWVQLEELRGSRRG